MSYGDDAEYSGSQRKYNEYFGINGKANISGKTKPIHNPDALIPKSYRKSSYKPKYSNNKQKSSYKPNYSKTYYKPESNKSKSKPKSKYTYLIKCSKCGRLYDRKLKYCPSCSKSIYDSSNYSSTNSNTSKWIKCKKCNNWYLNSKKSCPHCKIKSKSSYKPTYSKKTYQNRSTHSSSSDDFSSVNFIVGLIASLICFVSLSIYGLPSIFVAAIVFILIYYGLPKGNKKSIKSKLPSSDSKYESTLEWKICPCCGHKLIKVQKKCPYCKHIFEK